LTQFVCFLILLYKKHLLGFCIKFCVVRCACKKKVRNNYHMRTHGAFGCRVKG